MYDKTTQLYNNSNNNTNKYIVYLCIWAGRGV